MKKRNGRMGRAREEPEVDYGRRLKGKKSDDKRRKRRVGEEAGTDFGASLKGRTSNVQRPTFNAQRRERRVQEEPDVDYKRASKGRTPNAENLTVQAAQSAQGRIRRDERRQEKATDEKEYDLEERLLDYAARIIRLVDRLPSTRAGRHIADQLLRCGTSPQANHGELQGAESRKDFIHKLGVCLKELEESWRWLRLIHRVPMLAPAKIGPLLAETKALVKIFSASIRTAEKNKE